MNEKTTGDNNEDLEDEQLWSLVVKDVKPIKKEKSTKTPSEKQIKNNLEKPKKVQNEIKTTKAEDKASKPSGFTGLDKNTDKKLKKGKMRIDSRLDMHGLTKIEAYQTLKSFIERNYLEQKRTLLIVTGKGSREGSGIIKKSFPLWIQEPEIIKYVLQFYQAQPKDGGSGAYYVLLRRKR